MCLWTLVVSTESLSPYQVCYRSLRESSFHICFVPQLRAQLSATVFAVLRFIQWIDIWKQGSQLIESVECQILWTQFLRLQMQTFHKLNVRILRRVQSRLGACHIRGISQTKEKNWFIRKIWLICQICTILQNMLNMYCFTQRLLQRVRCAQ